MTVAETLLLEIRARGIVLVVQCGEHLDCDAPPGAVTPDLARRMVQHAPALRALVAAKWCPGPRLSILDLVHAHGTPAVRAALQQFGIDLAHRDPSWEELYVIAAVLEGTQ